MDYERIHQDVMTWLKRAAKVARRCLNETIPVKIKTSLSDVVTSVDRELERDFVQYIKQLYPTHQVLGEEGLGDTITTTQGPLWLIDPIDGTLNFVKERDNFGIMIALYVDGIGQLGYICDVMHDEIYYAQHGKGAFCNERVLLPVLDTTLENSLLSVSASLFGNTANTYRPFLDQALGIRMLGAACQSFIRVFNGQCGAYIASVLQPWDVAAGAIIAKELGLVCTCLDGQNVSLLKKNAVIVATPSIHQQLMTYHR